MQERRERGGARLSLLVVLALLAGLAVVGGMSAQASFPGTNGAIAFLRGGDIFTVNPFTLGETRITFSGGILSVNWNASSTQLTGHNAGGIFFVAPTAGAAPTGLPGSAAADSFPAYNPAGTKVTFATTFLANGAGTDIFTVDTNGANRTNLTNTLNAAATGETEPDWSSDGIFIVFEDNPAAAPFGIFRIGSAGGAKTQITPVGSCAAAVDCNSPSIFPNNTRVAYDRPGAAPNGIHTVNADGSSAAAFQLTTAATDIDPAVSPDNGRVVFGAAGGLRSTDTGGSLATTTVTTTAGDSLPSWGAQQVAPSPSPVVVSPTPVVPPGPGTQSGTVTRTKGGASRKQVQVCDTPVAPTPPLAPGVPNCIVVAKRAGSYSRQLPAGTYVKTASTGRLKRSGEFRVKQACSLSPASPVTITANATTTVNLVCPK